MKIEKDKRKVNIVLDGDILVQGLIYINPGERIFDFINDKRKSFIVLTNVEFLKRAIGKKEPKKNVVFINKTAVKWIEEV